MAFPSWQSKPDASTCPELPAIVTWIRFALGAAYGISLGLRNDTRGFVGSLFGLNVIAFMPMFWFNSYLDANIDSYKSLNFIGVGQAFAFMLLVWICFFTMDHGEVELSLGKVLMDATASSEEPSSMPETGMEEEF